MSWTQHQETVELPTGGRGLRDITERVTDVVRRSSVALGQCTVFLRHTSASLVIQENADPSARRDLEAFLVRLAPDGDPHHTHTAEGPDDMPSHIRAALTATTLTIPVTGPGALALGVWQGLYLWEHRLHPHRRQVVVHVIGERAGR